MGTGSYTTEATELQIRTNGFPLVASRRYDSSRAIDGALGYGWSSSVVARIYYASYLFAAPNTYSKEADLTTPDGYLHRFVENADGTFAPPPGRHDVLVKNGDGTFDLTLERTRSKYHFDASGALISMTDDYGNIASVTYDGNGRVQQVADASGSGLSLNVSWGSDGRISSIQDSAGRQVQYAYNGQGALTSVTGPTNSVTSYSYVTGRFCPILSEIRDNWNRVVSDITYDSVDRVQNYTDAGETYTYTYAYQNDPTHTAKADSAGNIIIYPFTAGGLISDTWPPSGAGGPTHTDYYPDGAVMQFTDGVGVKTFYTYTADGNPLSVTRDYQGPNAVRFDYTYDPNFQGKVASMTPKNPTTNLVDPTWQAWQYGYYQAGDPAPGALHHVYRVESDGTTLDTMVTYVYDSHGRVTKYTSATGGVTDYGYDTQGNLATVTGPANNDGGTRPVTTYGYDALRRVTSVTDALGHVTTYAYDNLDRVTSVTLPKPSSGSGLSFMTSYSYDNYDSASGLIFTNATDPNANVTKQGYDQFRQLVKTVDALGNSTTYGYTHGLLTLVTDANGNATGYAYDPGRRLSSTTFPDNAIEQYTYTGDNLLYQRTDRKNQTVTFNYDHFKRLQSKVYPSGSISYTFTGQQLSPVVDTSVSPSETHQMSYDHSYRVSSVTEASRGTVNYQYNADDTIANSSVQSGPSTTYSYYPDGSLNTIVWSPISGQFKYQYTLPGQYQTITFPTGGTRSFSYDDQGRLTQVSNLGSGGSNLATYAYAYDYDYTNGLYDRLGQRVSMTATVPSQSLNNSLFEYEYDSAYQLTRTTYPNVAPFNSEVDSWTYDAIGNRLTNTVNGSTQTYTYQTIGSLNWQRLLSDGVNSYTYDNNGNTATKTGFTFTWNYDDRMTGITGTSSYGYDYQGRRSSKTVGTTSAYLYDGLNLIHESVASTADYLFGPGIDEPLAMSRNGIYYYGVDGLGSATLVTDSSGAVQDSYLYDAWGQTRTQTGSLANPFGYTAREFGEVGTLFYRARYYSPTVGRFESEDPIYTTIASSAGVVVGLQGSGDRRDLIYGYVGNSPSLFRDPSGLRSCKDGQCPDCPGGLWTSVSVGASAFGFFGGQAGLVRYMCLSKPRTCDYWFRCWSVGQGVDLSIGVSGGVAGGKDCVCAEDLAGPSIGMDVGGGAGAKAGGGPGGGFWDSSRCTGGGLGAGLGFSLYQKVNNCKATLLGCR